MPHRDKTVSLRVNGKLYEEFLQTVEKFTKTFTIEYPSRTKTIYDTRFPDRPHSPCDKFTLADLVEETLRKFVAHYKDCKEDV